MEADFSKETLGGLFSKVKERVEKSKVSEWGSVKVAELSLEKFFGGQIKSYEEDHQIKNQ